MKTANARTNSDEMLSTGIDFNKRYSVVHVLDASGAMVKKGRIEPNTSPAFVFHTVSWERRMRGARGERNFTRMMIKTKILKHAILITICVFLGFCAQRSISQYYEYRELREMVSVVKLSH
ncbi:MAG: hypothetical protein KDN20_05755, partial [Verrucomicrobiae bacterium]|nr:hypothetical protein [Verrucomicrobiae bacterium]